MDETQTRGTLIVICGLPGTGKSTVARALAKKIASVYLRIDTIEQALRDAQPEGPPLDEAGYRIGYALASENLRLGRTVIAECVNPLDITREAWRRAAEHAGAQILNVELVCSDTDEHKRRVETRAVDVPNLKLPTWENVMNRPVEPWTCERLVIDTAHTPPDAAADGIKHELKQLAP